MNLDKEKLLYLLMFTDDYMEKFADDVMNDSEEDPHFSAVTLANMIKCYVDVMNELGVSLPYNDVKSFFKENLYSDEEYKLFEEKRKKEAEYYIGRQY